MYLFFGTTYLFLVIKIRGLISRLARKKTEMVAINGINL